MNRRVLIGVIAVGLALGASAAAARAPSISLTAPQSVAAASTYTIKVSGYFNCTKRTESSGNCGNIATVEQHPGTFSCSGKSFRRYRGHWTSVAGGPQDKRLRAKTPTTPGHFSAQEAVQAPSAPGAYTLCAWLLSYPVGRVYTKQMSTAHLTVSGTQTQQHTLTVSIVGPSSISGYVVNTTPIDDYGAQIDCGPDVKPSVRKCSHTYPAGARVTLEEVLENFNDTFAGWSGACSGTGQDCTVTMDADQTVTATFTAN